MLSTYSGAMNPVLDEEDGSMLSIPGTTAVKQAAMTHIIIVSKMKFYVSTSVIDIPRKYLSLSNYITEIN